MTEKRTIIFDGQVFQSAAWDRGMGKYSLWLAASMLKSPSNFYRDCKIIFSKHINLNNDARSVIKKTIPGAELCFLDLKAPKNIPGENIVPVQAYNQQVLEKYIDDHKIDQPDFVILSLFIDQVCSVFPQNSTKVLLAYDLIPLQYYERYSKSWAYPNYLTRYSVIFAADKILTISQTVADDFVVYTGISPDKLCNIDGAPIERGHQKPVKPKRFSANDFVLMPSGNDLRKNNRRAVQGFQEYISKYNKPQSKLVLTSYFDEGTKKELQKISSSIIFTGNVSEAELLWLYKNSQALLFVPEYEGLGLPVLEAAEVNKPIICSNLTVFEEMSSTAFYWADQFNPSSIATAIDSAVNQEGFASKKSEYPDILRRYTWEHTAKKTLDFLHDTALLDSQKKKPRIAVFAPNPSGYSAIGKVVMLTHAALSANFDVDYYVENHRSDNKFKRPSFLANVANVYPARNFTAQLYRDYDSVIYHVGNSEFHLETIKTALYLPGYVILHDTMLKNVFEDEMFRHAYIDRGRLNAERYLSETSGSNKSSYLISLVASQLGVIVHSDYAKNAVEEINIDKTPVYKLNLPVGTPRLKKNSHSPKFKLGFGGIIHKAKGISLVDEIANNPELKDIDISIFGIPLVDSQTLERLSSYQNVHISSNLTDFQFESILSEMDAIVSYRPEYKGETSLTVIEAMRYGVVPIVRSVGWFNELPDKSSIRVNSLNEVTQVLVDLINDQKVLNKKALAAKQIIASQFNYENYANDLQECLNQEIPENLSSSIHQALKDGNKQEALNVIKQNHE